MVDLARALVACAVVGGLLTSCQTTQKTVSVKQAKEITAKFDDRTFTPPPRKTEDIHRLLDVASEKNQNELVELRAKADALAPVGSSPEARAASLRDRAIAAGELGRIRQMIADLEAAAKEDLKPSRLLSEIYYSLGHAEGHNGNLRKAADYRRKALEALTSSRKNVLRRNSRYSGLAQMQVRVGNVDGAVANLKKSHQVLREARDAADNAAARGNNRLRNILPINEALTVYAEGMVAKELGDYRKAEEIYRRGLEMVERDIAKDWQSDFKLSIYNIGTVRKLIKISILENLAPVLARLGKTAEAEVMARDAIATSVARFGATSVYTASTLNALVAVLVRTGRAEEAQKLARLIFDIYTDLGVEPGGFALNKARRKLADTGVANGQWREALIVYEDMARAIGDNDVLLDRLYRYNLNRAVALLQTGQVEQAATVTGPTAQRLNGKLGAKHFESAEALGLHGVVLQRQSKTAEALAAFRRSFPVITKRSRQSDNGSGGIGGNKRLRLIFEGYLEALSAETDVAAIEESFIVANTARSKGVQEALSRSAARAAIKDPELRDLIRREQDTQHQIKAYYGILSNAMKADGQAGGEILALRTQLDTLRGARAALMQEIETRFPDYARLISPKPATVADVQKVLKPGESLLATYVAANKTYVWAIPKSGKAAFAVSSLSRDGVARVVRKLRRALDPNAVTLGDIPAFDIALSHDLYKQLLAPVRTGWQSAESLLVVANGALSQLPFTTLVTKKASLADEAGALFSNYRSIAWLARSHGVTVLPSVSSLVSLRALPAATPGRRNFVGFGDPYFSVEQVRDSDRAGANKTASLSSRGVYKVRGMPVSLRAAPRTGNLNSAGIASLPRLPDTLDEVRGIAAALHADSERDLFTGRRANEFSVKSTDLKGYKVIAFATHGLVPGDLDGLAQPALALSSPQVSGHPEEDGLLTMGEILGLKLDADWVVLSACNTGAGDGTGAEAFSGLGRAFFYAGTRALLLSNWPVETNSARALTTDLFRRQADDPSLGRAAAMRQAMLALIDGRGYVDETTDTILFSYAHPIFWAPFSLVGDSG